MSIDRKTAAVLRLGVNVLEDTLGELGALGESKRDRRRADDLTSFLADIQRRNDCSAVDLLEAARAELAKHEVPR